MTRRFSLRDTGSTVTGEHVSRNYYIISGLTVCSEVELLSAIPAGVNDGDADVFIREGEVPQTLPDAEVSGDLLQVAGDRVRISLPPTMDVLVERGQQVTFQRRPGALQGDLVMYLLGTTFAIVLHQRGRVVLHASAVAVNGRAILFCGVSGAGKSTLAAQLSGRGYPLLNDDVCNLSRRPDGSYEVHPDGRMLKLWAPSLEHLEIAAQESNRIRVDTEKFFAAPHAVDLTPRVVGAIYCLAEVPQGEQPRLEKLSVVESVVALTENAYRPALVHAMKMNAEYFAASVGITSRSGVYRLSRSKDFSSSDKVLDLLAATWQE